jgi:hypothetical protein
VLLLHVSGESCFSCIVLLKPLACTKQNIKQERQRRNAWTYWTSASLGSVVKCTLSLTYLCSCFETQHSHCPQIMLLTQSWATWTTHICLNKNTRVLMSSKIVTCCQQTTEAMLAQVWSIGSSKCH